MNGNLDILFLIQCDAKPYIKVSYELSKVTYLLYNTFTLKIFFIFYLHLHSFGIHV